MSEEELYEADSYTLTRLPCDNYSILWTIEDFQRFLSANYPCVESSTFFPIDAGSASFRLILRRESTESEFKIELKLVERADADLLNFNVRLHLLDKATGYHRKSQEFSPTISAETEDDQVLATFAVKNDPDELFEGETATIRCEMQIFADPINYPVTSKTGGYMHYSQLIDDLHRIYETKEFSDGVIEVEGREFFISRAVLAARSPVFKTMFTSGFAEDKTGRVKIEDFGAEVVQRMLDYIYTGRMGNIEELSMDLLAAGHKYCIEGVQTLAQEDLLRTIDVENVCELLIHADLYDAQMLKQQSIAFFAQHRAEVIKSEGWQQLTSQAHHNLVVELVESTKDLQI